MIAFEWEKISVVLISSHSHFLSLSLSLSHLEDLNAPESTLHIVTLISHFLGSRCWHPDDGDFSNINRISIMFCCCCCCFILENVVFNAKTKKKVENLSQMEIVPFFLVTSIFFSSSFLDSFLYMYSWS